MDTITSPYSQEDLNEMFGVQVPAPEHSEDTSIVQTSSVEEIPLNSNSYLVEETSVRFSSASWFEKVKEIPITIVGVGGIGSWTSFLLSRLHPQCITLYDSDTVDVSNISGQLFSTNDVGSKKTDTMCRFITGYSDYYNLFSRTRRLDRYNLYSIDKVLILGVDNMESRKFLFDSWKRKVYLSDSPEEFLFIDGRLAAEEFQIFCIKGTDNYLMNKYEREWLFDDSEAEETLCSYKQTSYCAAMIASYITNLFVNYVSNSNNTGMERDLPFLTRYDAVMMNFKTEL